MYWTIMYCQNICCCTDTILVLFFKDFFVSTVRIEPVRLTTANTVRAQVLNVIFPSKIRHLYQNEQLEYYNSCEFSKV